MAPVRELFGSDWFVVGISQRPPPHWVAGTFHDTAKKDHPMRTNRTPTATTMRPRGPTARRAYRARRSLRLMRLLHDLATREHDPEEEKDGHRARVDDDLNPSDEL